MRFAPNRLDKVDEVLERFAGRESELFDKLYKKYDAAGDGPDATKPDASAVGGQVNTLAQVRVEFAGCARRWWRRRQNDAPQCATMSCCSRLSRSSSTRSPSPCLLLHPLALTASPLPLSPPAQRVCQKARAFSRLDRISAARCVPAAGHYSSSGMICRLNALHASRPQGRHDVGLL